MISVRNQLAAQPHGPAGAPPLLPAVSASKMNAPTSSRKLLQMLPCTPTISPLVSPLRSTSRVSHVCYM